MDALPEDIQNTIYKYKHQIEFNNVMVELNQYNPNDIIESIFDPIYYRNRQICNDVLAMDMELRDLTNPETLTYPNGIWASPPFRRGLYTWCWYNIYSEMHNHINSAEILYAMNDHINCGFCGDYKFDCFCLKH